MGVDQTAGKEIPVLGVSEFVAITNQVLDVAFPEVAVVGELSGFRVSKNRWVYLDLKDETASVRVFGTVYMLPGPLEDGMLVEVRGVPRLHAQFGFSLNMQSIRPVGEGALRKAAELLQAKLEGEGLFDKERKRPLPYPPLHIGLVTSAESAAYADFIKVLAARWRGLRIDLADVQVQGERAPGQVAAAIRWFNQQAETPEALVIIRGGGSADDLAAFSAEPVVRAVAASRVPTLVAIGHEVDVSLAELAADRRASTPSNAAELLVPDRREVLLRLQQERLRAVDGLTARFEELRHRLRGSLDETGQRVRQLTAARRTELAHARELAEAFSPYLALRRGYAIVRHNGAVVHDGLRPDDIVDITLSGSQVQARVEAARRRTG